MTTERSSPETPRRGAMTATLLVNVALPLVLVDLAWKLDVRGFLGPWLLATAALPYAAPSRAAIAFPTRYDPYARVSVEPDHRLITSGFYSRVTHPGCTPVIVLCVGIALAIRSWFCVTPIPMMVFGPVRRMNTEERFLAEPFGDEYRAGMARTKRLFPGVCR